MKLLKYTTHKGVNYTLIIRRYKLTKETGILQNAIVINEEYKEKGVTGVIVKHKTDWYLENTKKNYKTLTELKAKFK